MRVLWPTTGQRHEDQREVCDDRSGGLSGFCEATSCPLSLHFDVRSLLGRVLSGRRSGFFAGTSWQDDPLFGFAVTALLVGPPSGRRCVDWSGQGRGRLS